MHAIVRLQILHVPVDLSALRRQITGVAIWPVMTVKRIGVLSFGVGNDRHGTVSTDRHGMLGQARPDDRGLVIHFTDLQAGGLVDGVVRRVRIK